MKKICKVCGKEFEAQAHNCCICSPECRRNYMKDYLREYQKAYRKTPAHQARQKEYYGARLEAKMAAKEPLSKKSGNAFEVSNAPLEFVPDIKDSFATRYAAADALAKENMIAKEAGYSWGKWQQLKTCYPMKYLDLRAEILASKGIKN